MIGIASQSNCGNENCLARIVLTRFKQLLWRRRVFCCYDRTKAGFLEPSTLYRVYMVGQYVSACKGGAGAVQKQSKAIEKIEPNAAAIQRLLASARRNTADAHVSKISHENRFDAA
jgi:hypothetical protein